MIGGKTRWSVMKNGGFGRYYSGDSETEVPPFRPIGRTVFVDQPDHRSGEAGRPALLC
ncbi:hypothetical protein CCHR01_10914 [Colletotrichum chrysophilum]|uniref:Uncharacterized protein n=1 Tax=Colletotrichum chrysophilum TaxID=1836956 RepID=A0AAD9AE81_9PEZI|nr:hypothetical protein CCHR01_10914 [Colletotrichum chrysophilum]